MKIDIQAGGIWYHGSNALFSHKPTLLGYDDDGSIFHNGKEKGYLYMIDEPIEAGKDIYQHPRSTMDENAEFLTNRPLSVRLVGEVGNPD